MMFDGEPEIVNGQHKYWKPMEYKGYIIVPYEGPVERMFLVANPKEQQWVYSSKKLEDCGVHIDMLVVADKFNKAEQKDVK